jgi:hypothetical protein
MQIFIFIFNYRSLLVALSFSNFFTDCKCSSLVIIEIKKSKKKILKLFLEISNKDIGIIKV